MATDKVVKAEPGDKVVKLSDTVSFIATKPADFPKGKKFYLKEKNSDGSPKVYKKMHRLHAERLQAKGFGKIVENK